MRQVGCYLSATWDRLSVSVSYMRQVGCYPSVTWDRLAVISQLQEAGFLSDTSGRLSVICQLIEAGGRLYVT
jgi:hypothetical protein